MTMPTSFAGADGADGRVRVAFDAGVNNRSNPARVAAGQAVTADNVDIDRDGFVARRAGYALVATLPGAHSLWSHPLLAFVLVADATKLYRMDTAGVLTTLVSGLNGTRLSYALIGQRVRWSNGAQTGQLDLLGDPAPLGVNTPLPSFVAGAATSGGLHAGRYGVTLTFATATREEGGAPDTVYVDVTEGGGVMLTGIPASTDTATTECRIYLTSTNGTELFHVASCAPGTASVIVGATPPGRLLATQFCEPFPAAAHLLARFGRLFGALGRTLVWSESMYYGLWRPTRNNVTLSDAITMVAAPDSPRLLLYLGTHNKTYLLQGDSIESATLSVANAGGVVPGSMVMAPPEALRMERVLTPVPLWCGTDGVPYAGTELGVLPLSNIAAYNVFDHAAATLVQQNGLSRYIVAGHGGSPSHLAFGDSVTATVVEAGP